MSDDDDLLRRVWDENVNPAATTRRVTEMAGRHRAAARGTCQAIVREWYPEEGWGVLDSPDMPGGCWAHFSAIEADGFRTLSAGQPVVVDWEAPGQDGYDLRAHRIRPISGLAP